MRACCAVVLVLLVGWAGQPAKAADTPVKVYVDNCLKQFDPPAIVREGKTYVPLRAGAEAVGAKVRWEASTRRAFVTSSSRSVMIRESQGIIVKDRLLVPLRLMGEAA